jgi:hypothetical protein
MDTVKCIFDDITCKNICFMCGYIKKQDKCPTCEIDYYCSKCGSKEIQEQCDFCDIGFCEKCYESQDEITFRECKNCKSKWCYTWKAHADYPCVKFRPCNC